MSEVNATAAMLIRKPVRDVFDAFVNPRSLEKFWLKRASGPLARDATVEWEFMVEGARETVTVTEFIPNQTIGFRWAGGLVVTLRFEPHDPGSTRLSVTSCRRRRARPAPKISPPRTAERRACTGSPPGRFSARERRTPATDLQRHPADRAQAPR